ncbi:hypothetical protein Ndes2526B_g00262 [Nannochloris sp. 'desiccata']
MGLLFGTFVFLVFEGAGFAVVEVTKGRKNSLLPQTLWATTVVCCWLMWAVVYLAQEYPLIRPVLQG